MIKLKEIKNANIFEFSIEGKIEKEHIQNLNQFFEQKSEQNEKVKLLGTMNEFPDIDFFKSFGKTLKMKKAAMESISKYAVLSDRDWTETILPIGNFVTPNIPIKHFDLDERDEAIAWLKNDDDNTVDEDKYLTKMNINKIENTDIFTFTVDGEIDEAGMTALYNILKNKNDNEKINLLGYYKDFDGFDSFKAFTEAMKADFAALSNMKKFAIVTDKKWARKLAEVESKIIPGISMKGFAADEETEAINWLKI
ncbi:SpoIIAA family protein [Winogradskyella bathintestinalis]|uniref:STAS/SEC14 domain-containing protein n=1 Tax=Winogradskyella bathintestinalis TaxID=3035208 RepID=A0ABT7ZX76_9FLAO|nr:STAS/SEC14 domain-containing protein [Winogradskyella bathintestinalis]MDN3493606.1 STAS/SEC14 domain-containing protein [Winogradskyella bathintestinalis]